MVEIDILREVKHPNIVGLYDAYCWDSNLWVSHTFSNQIAFYCN